MNIHIDKVSAISNRIIILLCVIYKILFLDIALAKDSICDLNFRDYYAMQLNSYAWTDSNLYIAKGFSIEQDDDPFYERISHYNVSKIDLSTRNIEVIYSDFHSPDTHLLASGNDVFLISLPSNVDLFSWKDTKVRIVNLTDSSEKVFEHCFTREDPVCDVIIYENTTYYICRTKVIKEELMTGSISVIYNSRYGIVNTYEYNHVSIDDEYIYIHDGNIITAVNLDGDHYCDIVQLGFSYERILSDVPYYYCVIDEVLYYWDDNDRITIALNTNTKEKNNISNDLYMIKQIASVGVVATIISGDYFYYEKLPFDLYSLIDNNLCSDVYIPFQVINGNRKIESNMSNQGILLNDEILIMSDNIYLDCSEINLPYPFGQWYLYVNIDDCLNTGKY